MAAECLDFSKPCHSIFLSKEAAKGLRVKRPLVDATLARLAAGIKRFVLEAELPYLHDGTAGLDAAHIVKFRGTSLGHAASEPLPTVTSGAGANRPAGAAHALGVVQTRLTPATRVVHHMEQANTGLIGHDLREPMSTVTTTGSQQRLVATSLASREEASSDAASAVYRLLCDHLNARDLALIEPYLRHGPRVRGQRTGEVAIQLHGEEMVLTDVGLRMLTPRELARAMGFEDDYVLDVDADGLPVPQHRQVALIGNSVCSAVLEAIVRSNSTDLIHQYQRSGQYIGRDHEDLQHTNSISKEVIQLTTAA
ncbi:MAG: hypothetical protein A2579_12355 [Lysobacterales bacterium RIFOXYD1_FULL_69_11]|nr:MAG: hypothetical protein A2579_12355 [Xanthomonadales bacterium RIFOXYD1_FULL_69_11]